MKLAEEKNQNVTELFRFILSYVGQTQYMIFTAFLFSFKTVLNILDILSLIIYNKQLINMFLTNNKK